MVNTTVPLTVSFSSAVKSIGVPTVMVPEMSFNVIVMLFLTTLKTFELVEGPY